MVDSPARPAAPRFLSSLIGRQRDLELIKRLLLEQGARLLTLTGAGGAGKTRLAFSVAEVVAPHFPDGVVTVMLSDLRDPALILPAIAEGFEMREEGSIALEERLVTLLSNRRVLLLLDNFEHLGEGGARVLSPLMAACPTLRVLVTSRVPLRLLGEQEYTVPPLGMPESDHVLTVDNLDKYDGIALFVQRARAVRPDFALNDGNVAVVVEICRRLDGLPLAIELAAARIKVMSPQALLARLSSSLRVLTGGPRDAPTRQRTMSDAIGWSYDLLTHDEQRLFRRLSVFVGGFSLEAAEAVTGGERVRGEGGKDEFDLPAHPLTPFPAVLDGIASLVDKSLIRQVEQEGEHRFAMLETIREYGLERLAEAGEEWEAYDRHADWCLAYATQHGSKLNREGQLEGFRQLATEIANIRQALIWCEAQGERERLMRLTGFLWFFWFGRNLHEGGDWVTRALAVVDEQAPPDAVAQLTTGVAVLSHYLGDDDRAVPAAEEALARWRALDDPGGGAVAQMILGFIAEDRGDYDTAERFLEQAVASSDEAKARGGTPALFPPGLTPGTVAGWCWFHFGVVFLGKQEIERATAAWEHGLDLFRGDGHSWGVSVCIGYLGLLAIITGDLPRAASLQRQSLDLRWAVGPQEDFAGCLSDAALLAASGGHYAQAARLFGSVTSLRAVAGGNWRLPERNWYERAQAESRAALGDEAFAAAFASGRDLSLIEAAAEASAAIDAATAVASSVNQTQAAPSEDRVELTQREIEVLKLLAEGRSTPEMAEMLFISPRTVGTHVANLLAKLGVDSRAAAVSYAFRHNLA